MLLNIALLGQYIQNLDFDLYSSNDNVLFSLYVDFVVLITCIKTYVHNDLDVDHELLWLKYTQYISCQICRKKNQKKE